MPIRYTKTKGWFIDKPTEEESKALIEVGKMMVVEGLAGAFTNERYANFLKKAGVEQMFNA
jgi:fructose-1-phosphate kinase PfkB-like protein